MRDRNISHPEKNITKGTYTASTTVVPDLKLVNVFRYNTTEDITIANPKNLSDGEYIRIEVSSVDGKSIEFGSKYKLNGEEVPSGLHDSTGFIIYDGWYNQDEDNINIVGIAGGNIWYVRPSGGSYGSEDGSSYADAWDGFSNIDWTAAGVQPGDTLYIVGTHTEVFTIGGSGESDYPIVIRGDYSGDAGVIDSEDTRNTGVDVNSKDYVTITSLSSIDAIDDCFQFRGTSSNIITNTITATGSGNQGIQHEDSVSVTHNNPVCTGNADDGISGHDSAVIVINGGTITNNSDGVNIIADVKCTINGPVTFSGNTNDLWATSATTPNDSCQLIVYDCVMPSAINSGASILLYRCISSGNIDLELNAIGELKGYNTLFSGSFNHDDVRGALYFDSCVVKDSIDLEADCGTLYARNSWFIAGSTHCIDTQDGTSVDIKYCIFTGMGNTSFGVLVNTGATAVIDNCTFWGTSASGKGVVSLIDLTINNCIFNGLVTGVHQVGGNIITNNCSFYANTSDVFGTVTQNNSQTADPKLTNPASDDFSLDVGSSCIETGKTLTSDEGIDAADWGNGTSETPEVTTKEQSTSWDIGAYISRR